MPPRPAIADHALLADGRTAALVARDGTVDWWCPGRFDAPSAFARLLDDRAGHWELAPVAAGARPSWRYLPGTLVLETTWDLPGGRLRVVDALALGPAGGHQLGRTSPQALARSVAAVAGQVEVRMVLRPRPDDGAVVPHAVAVAGGADLVGGGLALELRTDVAVAVTEGEATATFRLRAGEVAGFVLQVVGEGATPRPEVRSARHLVAQAIGGWTEWSDQHRHDGLGPHADLVRTSALVLQGLTYQPTGAVVAAPTTSLPEVVGGGANWDYRFAWLRDASLTVLALAEATCTDEARSYLRWVTDAVACDGDPAAHGFQVLYGVEPHEPLGERTLEGLAGHLGSRPVRVGNDAWRQRQLDVPGHVLDAAWQLRDQLAPFEPTMAAVLVELADLAATWWREPDAGIWEGREGDRHFTSSKAMAWVALDRAAQMAAQLGRPERAELWRREAHAVHAAVLAEAWHDGVGAYAGAFGSDHLDASVLLLPLVGFLPVDDARMWATIERVAADLGPDGWVRRWTGAPDGAFVLCTCWLIDCLARAGHVERATALLDQVAAHANDLGLLSEEVDPATGALLGNFPQGLSHVGFINAAASVRRAGERAG